MALIQQAWAFSIPISEAFRMGVVSKQTDTGSLSDSQKHAVMQTYLDGLVISGDPPAIQDEFAELTIYDAPFGIVKGALETLWISDSRYFPQPDTPVATYVLWRSGGFQRPVVPPPSSYMAPQYVTWSAVTQGLFTLAGSLYGVGTAGIQVTFGSSFTEVDNIFPDITCIKGSHQIACAMQWNGDAISFFPAVNDATLYYRLEWLVGDYQGIHVERGRVVVPSSGEGVVFASPYTDVGSMTIDCIAIAEDGGPVACSIAYGSSSATFTPAITATVFWRALGLDGTETGTHIERGIFYGIGTLGQWATFASAFANGTSYFPRVRCQSGTSHSIAVYIGSFTAGSFFMAPAIPGGTLYWRAEQIQ